MYLPPKALLPQFLPPSAYALDKLPVWQGDHYQAVLSAESRGADTEDPGLLGQGGLLSWGKMVSELGWENEGHGLQAEDRKHKGLPKRAKRVHRHPGGGRGTAHPERMLSGQWAERKPYGRDQEAVRQAQARP